MVCLLISSPRDRIGDKENREREKEREREEEVSCHWLPRVTAVCFHVSCVSEVTASEVTVRMEVLN